MVDIRDFPGALDALNSILNSGREATLRVEYDKIAVAEHSRHFCGVFAVGDKEPQNRFPNTNKDKMR